MSSTTTQWVLELIDRVSKPLRTITKAGNTSTRSIGSVERMLKRVETRSNRLRGSLRRMMVGAAVFGVLSAGSVSFENGMARANTMAHLGTVELEKYTNQVRDIADVVPIAKKQLSEGLYATISAGVPKQNWISYLNQSSRSAVAGNAELGTVVDTTASIIKAYGAEWNTAIAIQDKLQKTVELGQIPSLESLGTALPRVTALSAKLNISQKELFGTFATASGVMGKPAEVATQLNAVLSSLLKPSSEAIEVANKLGIAFNATSISKAGGLRNYITSLLPVIQNYAEKTGATQEELIGKLFGSQEAIKLVIGLGGKLSNTWLENTTKIGNATGTVNSAFNIMAKTTQSQMLLLKNSFSNAMDGVVKILAPFAIVIFKVLARVMKFVSGFMRAHPKLSKFIIVGISAIAMIVGLGTVLSLASLRLNAIYLKLIRASLGQNIFTSSIAKATLFAWNFVKSLFTISMRLAGQAVGYALVGASMLGSFLVGLVSATAAQLGLNVALNANPIGLIVIGIAAAVGAIALMIKYWDKIKMVIWKFTQFVWKISPFRFIINLVEKIFPGFKKKVAAVFTYVKDLVLGFWEKIKEVWGNIKQFFGFGEDSPEIVVKTKPTGDFPFGDMVDPSGNVRGLVPGGDLVNPSGSIRGLVPGGDSFGTPPAPPSYGGNDSGTTPSKTITMTLNIKNIFNVGSDFKERIDDVADEIIGRINDRLRDSLIIAE